MEWAAAVMQEIGWGEKLCLFPSVASCNISTDSTHRHYQQIYIMGHRKWTSACQPAGYFQLQTVTDNEFSLSKIWIKLKRVICQQERNGIDMLNSCETEPDEVGDEIKDILKTKNISKISKKKISKWLSKQTFMTDNKG